MIIVPKIDWKSVLISLGFEIPEGKNEILTKCPFHDDRHPSLSINLKKAVYICHAGCSKGKLSDFVAHLGDMELSSFAIEDVLDDELVLLTSECKKDSLEEQKEQKVPFLSTNYPQWIYKRGFTTETLMKWDCVVNEDTQSLIIPIKSQYNKCIGWVARKAPGRNSLKYLYSPSGIKISHILFGLWQYSFPQNFLCLVEGPLDAMWLAQHSFPAVALGGAHLSEIQEKILLSLPLTEVVLCFDNDEAGRIVDEDAKSRLNKYFMLSRIEFDSSLYKDVQDIRDVSILKQVIKNRKLAW